RPQTVAQRLQGLADAAALLQRASSSAAPPETRQALGTLNSIARAMTVAVAGAGDAAATLHSFTPEIQQASAELERRAGEEEELADVLFWSRTVLDALASLETEPAVAPAACEALAARARGFVDAMRFEFLYERRRRLFAIGYRLADADGPGRFDGSFYDLLASEA